MKRNVWLILATATALGMAAPASSQLIDGEFDLATSGTTTSGSGWDLIVNTPDGVDPAAQFQTGFANANNTGVGGSQQPGIGSGVWFRSFEGNQVDGDNLANAVLTQTFSLMARTEANYTLEFVVGREENFTAREFSVAFSTTSQTAEVDLLASGLIPGGNLGGAASGNPGGTPFSLTLLGVMPGEPMTVTAVMLDGEDSMLPGGQSAFLDDFSVRSVPEPTSAWQLGLGLAALLGRRRRS